MEYPMLSITVLDFRLNKKLKDTQGTESVMEKVFRSFNIKKYSNTKKSIFYYKMYLKYGK